MTFKDFLHSELLREGIDIEGMANKGKGSGTVFEDEEHILLNGGKLISKTKSGHKVYMTVTKGTTRKEYHAVNPDTLKVDVSVDGNEKNNVISKILLKANPGNTIKAHDFYHHLIMKHDKVLVHDLLSPGGKAVLKKLNTKYHATVATHGWLDGKAVNVTDKDDDYVYGSEGEGNAPEQVNARKMQLVTYKKK